MKVVYLEPNHICQNEKCTKGKDGKPKHYYACDYCGWSYNWRSICCCRECYLEMNERATKKPKRTDKSKKEVEALMTKAYDEVIETTMAELADFKEIIDEIGIGPTVDLINEEIDHRDENVE